MIWVVLLLGPPVLLATVAAMRMLRFDDPETARYIEGYIQDTFQERLGFKEGMDRARRVARLVTRRGYGLGDLDWASRHFTGCPRRIQATCAAEALAALQLLRLPASRATDTPWLTAFAGPGRDGAPLRTFDPLLQDPKQWRAWVNAVGGPEHARAIINAGIEPDEGANLARAGALDLDALTALAALR